MKVYLDYIFFINVMFDFLLLLSVTIVLKRNIKISKIILGALLGGISTFFLFLKINSLELFIFKFVISILMVLVTFSYKNFKYTLKNLSFLYMASMVLGGVLYFFNIQFSYNHEGLVFYHSGVSINLIIILILSPIIIYTYIKQCLNLKINYSKYSKVDIKYKGQTIKLTGFMDTGNKLVDPITNIPIIIVEEEYIKKIDNFMFVPYNTISGKSMLKCIKADEIKINDKKIDKKVLVGLTKNINMNEVNCILNSFLMEEIC